MDCDQAQNLLSARLDREITPADLEALTEHMQTCPICRGTAEVLTGLEAELRRGFAGRRAAASSLAERVVARLQLAPPARPARRFTWLPMLLSAAAGFLLAVGLFRPWQPAAQTGSGPVPPPPVVRETEKVQLALSTGPV